MKDAIGAIFALVVALLMFLVLPGFLLLNNPTQADMGRQIQKDGWVPVAAERTNLLFFNIVRIDGFTGAKATYLGIGGGIFKLPWSDD